MNQNLNYKPTTYTQGPINNTLQMCEGATQQLTYHMSTEIMPGKDQDKKLPSPKRDKLF